MYYCHNYLGEYTKHIVNCSYYQRLVDSTARIDGEARGTAMVGAVHFTCWFTAEVITTITGGLSIPVAAALTTGVFIGYDLLIENNIKKTVKEIENELKEKW